MKVAYADPPYPGQARKHYKNHPDYAGEVDHAEVIEQLVRDYPDGWALSTSANSLQFVLALCPNDVRIAIWCKSNAMPVKGIRVSYAYEALIFRGGRSDQRHSRDFLRDYLVTGSMGGFRGGTIVGQKPPEFSKWLFKLLGLEPGDEFVDLFPGSGSVYVAWIDNYKN